MRLSNCYHPKMVVNKYTKELVVARCGKCPACVNARSANWVQRLDYEMQQHRYTFFGTFQYDEFNVNQLVRLRPEDYPFNLPAYIDSDSGMLVSLADCPGYTKADIDYCNNTKVLLVHNTKDFQKFMKLLRKDISKNYNNARLRYYVTFEYGPTTFRPHIHSLFFIDSPLLAKDFAELCSKHWKYGNTFDVHSVCGSASQYVASYVNSTTNLPKIYLHPNIKQKSLFSKSPSIGSFEMSGETFKQLFYTETPSLTIYRKDVHKFCDVPLWRSLQDKLFPRITAFNRLSHFDRVELYRKGKCRFYQERNYKLIVDDLTTDYWMPYFQLAFKSPNRRGIYISNRLSLAKFVSIVLRVCENADKFGISIDDYVTRIENYYDTKQKSDLREYYQLQEVYFASHPASDILLISANFYISTKNKHFNHLKDWEQYYLDMYMPNKFHDDDIIDYNYSDAFCYRELLGLHNKIYFDNTKRKKSNDYLEANKDKFDNIITYNQELENYVKSEII